MKKQLFCLMSIIALMLMVPTVLRAADYVPRIVAGVVKADSWTLNNNKEGVYQLEVKEGGQLVQLNEGQDKFLAPLGGAVYQDGTMYGIHFKQEYDPYDQANTYTIYNVAYDMQTWQRTKGVALSNMYGNLISSCGITHDPVTGKNYGIFYNFNMSYQVINRKLATIDFLDCEQSGAPKKEIIGIVETPFAAIAAADNGLLYGVGQDGYLYVIDKVMDEGANSVTVYPLGDLGIEDISTNPSSMAFDPRTKKLYWSYVSTSYKSYLYEISYTLGQPIKATKVMDVPDNAYLVNMYIAPTQAGAPEKATDLALAFEGEKLTGNVQFTMPTQTQDGDALTGALQYVITANGTQVATGSADAGTPVVKEVTVPKSGDTEIRVIVKNGDIAGDFTRVIQYIGHDTPQAVTNVHLSYNTASGNAELTWDAPTQGLHGKTLTQTNLRYKVVRQPANQVVAEATMETSFREPLSNVGELQSYSYEVTAINGEFVSEAATSNAIVLGDALEMPFTETFTTDAGFNRFTVIDANNDGKKWARFHKYYSYSGTTVDAAAITAHSTNADDDWLMTPVLRMDRGSRYSMSFEAKKAYGDAKYDQKVEVWFGQGDDPAAYTKLADVDVAEVEFEKHELELVPESDGNFRVALHAVSKAGSDQLLVTNVKIAAPLAGTAPADLTEMTITAGEKGALTATVTVTTPTTNVRGDALTSITKVVVLNEKDQVVGTTENPAVGQQCTIACTGLKNGFNTLTALAYNGENAGPKTKKEAFIGVDRPNVPENVNLYDNGTEAMISWTAPTTGYFGRYINPEALNYHLFTISNDGYADIYKENITSPYNTGDKTNEGDQHLLYYALCAESVAGDGPIVATNSLVVGAPYPMPFMETFSGGLHTNQFVWFEGENFDKNFTLQADAVDDDNATLTFTPNYATAGVFSTGKIAMDPQATDPVLTFWHKAKAGDEGTSLLVFIDRLPQNTLTHVVNVDYAKETEDGWQQIEVDLKPFQQYPYIVLRFGFVSTSTNYTPIKIDGIRVFDKSNDAISSLQTKHVDSQRCYTLDGRMVRIGSQLPKGIYIVGGKKTVVK